MGDQKDSEDESDDDEPKAKSKKVRWMVLQAARCIWFLISFQSKKKKKKPTTTEPSKSSTPVPSKPVITITAKSEKKALKKAKAKEKKAADDELEQALKELSIKYAPYPPCSRQLEPDASLDIQHPRKSAKRRPVDWALSISSLWLHSISILTPRCASSLVPRSFKPTKRPHPLVLVQDLQHDDKRPQFDRLLLDLSRHGGPRSNERGCPFVPLQMRRCSQS